MPDWTIPAVDATRTDGLHRKTIESRSLTEQKQIHSISRAKPENNTSGQPSNKAVFKQTSTLRDIHSF